MQQFLLISATGWAAVFALGVEIALPYLLKNRSHPALSPDNRPSSRPPLSFRQRLWPHYWIGYVLAVLILIHSSAVMGPTMARSDPAGIWAATLALGLVLMQIAVGLVLKSGSVSQRALRRVHFWSMLSLTVLVVVHLWRNG
jgi:hypothetical protein